MSRIKPPARPPFRAARAFYLTLLLGTTFAIFALFTSRTNQHTSSIPQNAPLLRRRSDGQLHPFSSADEQCRLVHRAKDQCAFVKAQCPNEEAGFAAYLDLYYCQLPRVKAVAFAILISWLGLLFSTIGIAASDFFCINLSTIATILGMSESMAGVTFLAFGNGSPDVFSTFAAMSTDSGSLAVGELFGAAGFITAVVSGSMALIRPFHVARKSFIRDVGFFVVAAAFSIVFLWDGKLHMWECITMVVFYCFYVAFVVAWHWWLGRRRRRREREAAIRGHYVPPDELDLEEEEHYFDDPDEPSTAVGTHRHSIVSNISREDWSALERGGDGTRDEDELDEDEEEEARDRWMSELSSNMRLTRGAPRSRRNTVTPVRPSLMGALEFQAVLNSLQKSRNIQQNFPMPGIIRRYSDDPNAFGAAQDQDAMSSVSDPSSRPPYQLSVQDDSAAGMDGLDAPTAPPGIGRNRAVSAADAADLIPDLAFQEEARRASRSRSPSPAVEREESLINFSGDEDSGSVSPGPLKRTDTLAVPTSSSARHLKQPILAISPATPRNEAPIDNTEGILGVPSSATTPKSPNLLAPPSDNDIPHGATYPPPIPSISFKQDRERERERETSPRPLPHAKQLPKINIPGRERSRSRPPTPTIISPGITPQRYRDVSPPASSTAAGTGPTSLSLPSPASPEGVEEVQEEVGLQHRPSRLSAIWPYSILPPPGVVISTLFPTIYHWNEKNYWEKALGVVAAPSVFLLTITLPVVESGKDDEGPKRDASYGSSSTNGVRRDGSASVTAKVPLKNAGTGVVLNDPTIHMQEHGGLEREGAAGQGTTTGVVAAQAAERAHERGPAIYVDQTEMLSSSPVSENRPHLRKQEDDAEDPDADLPELWNRWLLIVQLFLAPLFIVFAIYTQSPTDITPAWLVKPVLICLLVSVILLIPLLLTTTPFDKPRGYRYILSLAGFTVSIAWISTVASQVVGALKALAVILNMSHAIMGLTIFAVGNSLGDLVADVTVARLGYPVMALSACFGGPMLNILLGIGLSGSYLLVNRAQKRVHKHPDKDFKFKSYHIEVSNTLLISGATLLVTLVGLLIFVPMNKWVFSKRIGWSLIAVWVLSTIGNVVVEVVGIGGEGGGQEDLFVGW